jgi:bacillithiol system protein YtxJ
MAWIPLTSEAQLDEIVAKSANKTQVIFKHSTRCSISAVAQQRLQKAKFPEDIDFYYLDLIAYRSVSNQIADRFNVHHESPQVLVIKDGKCVYDESHLAISVDEILDQSKAA